jgi:hypothetical protein
MCLLAARDVRFGRGETLVSYNPWLSNRWETRMSADLRMPNPRRVLSADGLIDLLHQRFGDVQDDRRESSVSFAMSDCLMAAFAMFSLKDPSLLAFQERQDDPSLKNLYHISKIPSDTQMRDILDPVQVDGLNECFADIFHELQRGGVLKDYMLIDGNYLLAIDGTGYFSSSNIHCPSCLEKINKAGKTKYAHQMVAAVLVHPSRKEVIPLAIEPIVKQDGQTKNDCERNATRRLLARIKQQHPKLKLIVTEDGLASNAPHIEDLRSYGYHYILGAKPGDHAHLFESVIDAGDNGKLYSVTMKHLDKKGSTSQTQWAKGMPLNASHADMLVNFIDHTQFGGEGNVTKRFSWVTDLPVTAGVVGCLVRAGRSRWRIENETFNTLKNQGYHFEHNYGHGKQNLSTVLATLMMLAFLVDQVQQACCPLFQAVLAKVKSRRSLWDRQRSAVLAFVFRSFRELYESLLTDRCRNQSLPSPYP